MLLLSPQRAALAMGVQCRSPDGAGEEGLLEILRLLTPRVEAALNVLHLERNTWVDRFSIRPDEYTGDMPFRLGNGFLVPGSVTVQGITDSDGTAATPSEVDEEGGLVWFKGAVFSSSIDITYQSGFVVPEPPGTDGTVHPDRNYRVLQDVPDWISGVVANLLVTWMRNQQKVPSAPKEYGFLPTLNQQVLQDLRARIYERYMRRRHYLHFSLTTKLAA
jgi:hypothetical protein